MKRAEAYDRLDRVCEEFRAARFSLAETRRSVHARPEMLLGRSQAKVTIGTLQRCDANLDVTYLIRLFAEFEAALLDYWRKGLRRATRPSANTLIDRIAAARRTNTAARRGADKVRDYRNDVVHDQTQARPLSFEDCLSGLNCFLSWLPPKW